MDYRSLPGQAGIDGLLDYVRSWLSVNYPGWTPDELTISLFHYEAKKNLTLPIGGAAPTHPISGYHPSDPTPPPTTKLTPSQASNDSPEIDDTEEEVLDAMGADELSGKEIAAKLGRAYCGGFRTILSRMVAKPLITKTPRGYKSLYC